MYTVSVIIPVYNDSIRIELAIKSLLSQTYPDLLEIVICDNGSTDSTTQVIQKYHDMNSRLINLVYENEIQSSYAARNKALQIAKGDIIFFTDSDCVLDEKWIENGVKALKKEGAECGGGKISFFFKTEIPNVYEYFDSVTYLNQKAYVENLGFAATANFFTFKRNFIKYGYFRDDLISGGDSEFVKRITSAGGKLIYAPDAIVFHPALSSFKKILKKMIRVSVGVKKLKSLGLLTLDKIPLRRWRPTLKYPRDGYWSLKFSTKEKMQLILLSNIHKYLNIWRQV